MASVASVCAPPPRVHVLVLPARRVGLPKERATARKLFAYRVISPREPSGASSGVCVYFEWVGGLGRPSPVCTLRQSGVHTCVAALMSTPAVKLAEPLRSCAGPSRSSHAAILAAPDTAPHLSLCALTCFFLCKAQTFGHCY